MAITYKNSPVLSKVKIGEQVYWLKDAESRTNLETLLGTHALEALGAAAWEGVDEAVTATAEGLPTTKAVKNYVDAQIEALPEFDVVVDSEGTESGPSVPASADTFHKIYLVPAGKVSGSYVEWITIRSGSEGDYTYEWEKIGTTEIDLKDYLKNTATVAGVAFGADQAITKAELQEALDLGVMAYADTASGSTALETIDAISMKEITIAGDATVTSSEAEAELTKGDYTPAGEITGEAIKGGSINVTLKDAAEASAADLTYAAYTPAGEVTLTENTAGAFQPAGDISKPDVALSGTTNISYLTSITAGKQAAFTEGAFVPAEIQEGFYTAGSDAVLSAGAQAALTDPSTDKFAKEGVVAAIDATDTEMLVFTAAAKDDAVTDRGTFTANILQTLTGGKATVIDTTKFSGGDKKPDTFTTNELQTSVSGEATAFTKGAAAASLVEAPVFTGKKYAPAFAGTEVAEMKVTKAEYVKQAIDEKSFTPVAATLGFFGTKSKDVLVTGVSYKKADETAAYSTKVTPEVDELTKTAKNIEITVYSDKLK